MLVSALMCSRLVFLLAGTGTTLLYLSMFQLASGMSAGHSMATMSAQSDRAPSPPSADVTTLYLGLFLLAVAMVLMSCRRRRRECRPLARIPQALTARR